MLIIGCDYHPGVQQIAFMDTETGECGERRLQHGEREAEKFYRDLAQTGISVRVGMEATGHARWFERLLAELNFELWIGDPVEIRATRVRKQKTDRHDAQLLLKLLLEDRFPHIWIASWENRDLRQLLWHRHRLVQMRTRIKNQLQAVALNEGVQRKKRLWGQAGRAQLESFVLAPWASLGLVWQGLKKNEMAHSPECKPKRVQRALDSADIVRDGIYQQQSSWDSTTARFQCLPYCFLISSELEFSPSSGLLINRR
ncbi:MAG: IS110 family transposase [Candidatus Acidiferrales bacterium]